ncbi:MAG: hypothetical protein IJW13_01015 [Clostridia bacterium]|nr:hypothetical protein [Clostridia bacterium]
MKLIDEIMNEKNARSEAAAEKERLELEKERVEKELAIKEAEIKRENNKVKFENLKKDLSNGIVPEEWEAIYQRFAVRIKDELINNAKTRFYLEEETTEEYYNLKVSVCSEGQSEKELMNEYLTNRLKEDGFYACSFCLSKIEERYALPSDYEKQKSIQEEYDEDARRKNDEIELEWFSDYLDGEEQSRYPRYVTAKVAPLICSGIKYVYKIVCEGSTESDAVLELDYVNIKPPKKLFLTAIITSVFFNVFDIICLFSNKLQYPFFLFHLTGIVTAIALWQFISFIYYVKRVCKKYRGFKRVAYAVLLLLCMLIFAAIVVFQFILCLAAVDTMLQ